MTTWRRLPAVLAAVALALCWAPAAHAAGTPTNGGFEADGGTANPTGWTTGGTTSASFTEAGGRSGSYRLAHYSPSAYEVETRQVLTGVSNGWHTLRVWVRSGGTSHIALRDCGGAEQRTYLPISAGALWIELVVSTQVTTGRCTIALVSKGKAGSWANFDDVRFTTERTSLPIRGGDVSSLKKGEDHGAVYR